MPTPWIDKIRPTFALFYPFERIERKNDENEEIAEIEEEEASQTECELLEAAGELLVTVAMVDPAQTMTHMLQILEVFEILAKSPDSNSKSATMEIIANFFDAIGNSEKFASKLFDNYCEAIDNAEDDDVLAKSIYAIGIIIATSGQIGPPTISKAISKLPLASDIDPKIAVRIISSRF